MATVVVDSLEAIMSPRVQRYCKSAKKLNRRELSCVPFRLFCSLAFRLGTSQKRVRQIRDSGLADVLAIRDWIQAITGTDPGPIPEKYRINKLLEEGSCCFCGYPLYTGDEAFDYVGEMFCSISCARKSRGW